MADDSTLTAYLVPRLTKQVENAATDALSQNSWGPSASRVIAHRNDPTRSSLAPREPPS